MTIKALRASSTGDNGKRVIRIRTCIVSRQQQPDTQLLRLVAQCGTPPVIVPDPQRDMPGRGCWITPTLDALELAEKRNAIGRALRVSAPVDTGPVRKYLAKISDEP